MLRLFDNAQCSGEAIDDDDDGGDGTNSQLDFAAIPNGGSLAATALTRGETGAYTLTLEALPPSREEQMQALYQRCLRRGGESSSTALGACDSLIEMVSTDQHKAMVLSARALRRAELGQSDRILPDAESAVRYDETSADAFFALGLGLTANERNVEAVTAFSRAIALSPDWGQAYRSRGLVQANAGNYADAVEDLSEAINHDLADAEAYRIRGLVRIEIGELAAAQRDLSTSVQLQPDSSQHRSDLGKAYVALENVAEARNSFNEAIRLDASNTEARHALARLETSQNNRAAAVRQYDAILQAQPTDAAAWYERGRARHALEQYAPAIADLSEAIRLQPDDANIWASRAAVYSSQGNMARALTDLDEAVRLAPDSGVAYKLRYDAHMLAGHFPEAIADADRATQLEPGNANYQNSRCWARAVAGVELEIAEAACNESLRLAPGQAGVLDSRALVRLKSGRAEQAWSDYDDAVRGDGERAHYRYGRGLAALKMGRETEGRADIAAALALDPTIAETFAGYGLRPE